MRPTAQEIIEQLGLAPHPEEGGFFAETHRSAERLPVSLLAHRYESPRSMSTAIYYLLTPQTFSHMHRLASEEIFHFYLGDPCEMLQLRPDNSGRSLILGHDMAAGQRPQVVVERGIWQGMRLLPGGEYALLGCTVAPGFEYEDYEHGQRSLLLPDYPEFAQEITRLTLPDLELDRDNC